MMTNRILLASHHTQAHTLTLINMRDYCIFLFDFSIDKYSGLPGSHNYKYKQYSNRHLHTNTHTHTRTNTHRHTRTNTHTYTHKHSMQTTQAHADAMISENKHIEDKQKSFHSQHQHNHNIRIQVTLAGTAHLLPIRIYFEIFRVIVDARGNRICHHIHVGGGQERTRLRRQYGQQL